MLEGRLLNPQMLSRLYFIGAVFWTVISAAVIDNNETIVTLFAKTYRDFMNINTTDVLAGNSDYGFYLNELYRRLQPIGELVRIMPTISTSKAGEKDRMLCMHLVRVLLFYDTKIVPYKFCSDVSKEYDTHILPILYKLNEALLSESLIVPVRAGFFAASCKRYRSTEILDVFERLFRENCQIDCDCHRGSRRNRREVPTIQFNATYCVLKTLASDHKFEKKNVTDRVRLYGKDLLKLWITTILCDYSIGVDVSFEYVAFSHAAQITKIARHIVEYVNSKMGQAWPNVSAEAAKIALRNYMLDSLVAKDDFQMMAEAVQNRLNEIGDYRHAYQVLISSAKTLSVVSTESSNVIFIADYLGIDCLVVRHKIGQGMTALAERAHRIMMNYTDKFTTYLGNYEFRPDSARLDLEYLGEDLELSLPSEQTYSTVVVEQSGQNGMFHGLAFTGHNDYWNTTNSKRYRYRKLYNLLFLL